MADFDRIKNRAHRRAEVREDTKADLVADFADWLDTAFLAGGMNNGNLQIVAFMLGYDIPEEKVRAALPASIIGKLLPAPSSPASTPVPDQTPAAPVSGRPTLADFWRVYEADGSTMATDLDWVHKLDTATIVRFQLQPLLDPSTNQQTGLKKPPAAPAPMPALPAQAGDTVKVVNRKGEPVKMLTRDEYNRTASRYSVSQTDALGRPTVVRNLHLRSK